MPQLPFSPIWGPGYITVPIPGTPVGLMDALSSQKTTATSTDSTGKITRPWAMLTNKITFQAKPGNAGQCYIGTKNMVRATGVGVLLIIPIPAATANAVYNLGDFVENDMKVEDYYVDADNANDGVLPVVTQSGTLA